MNFLDCPVLQDMKVRERIFGTAQSLQTENGQWKRSERATRVKSVMDGGDLQEADHSTVNCVGLFGVDGGKDRYFCKSTCVIA